MFFDHTRKVIFEEHELRSLQSLLRDYCSIISQFGFPTSGVRSSFIKEILRREFKGRIGFHSRPERNHSELVYDVARIRSTHNALAIRNQSKWKHTDCGPKRLRQDELCVQDLIACMHKLDSFPFNPASHTLRTLESAMPASSQLVADFNSAHAAGEIKFAEFLKEQVYSKTTSLHACVPLSKCLTFAK